MNDREFILDTEQHRDNAARFIGNLDVTKPKKLVVSDNVAHRSTTQNARMWALHSLAGAHTGYSKEEMHEHALCRHFGYTEVERVDPLTGELTKKRVPNERSSTKDKVKFARFMEETEAWYINDFGVWLDQQRAA